MINLEHISVAYFIGIGGVGMSAIARYFLSKGIAIYGYDRTATSFTAQLESEGMTIHYHEDASLIPANVDIVVFTPAIPKTNLELQYCITNNIPIYKRSQVLEAITSISPTIAIAGTHGKSTISSMIGHILYDNNFPATSLIGAVTKNYDNNFISKGEKYFVVEADEYDRSFLRLHPQLAVVTAMDADHLDIYGTEQAMRETYQLFANQVADNGLLITHNRTHLISDTATTENYDRLDENDALYTSADLELVEGFYHYNIIDKKHHEAHAVTLQIGGLHNIENSLAAYAVCRNLGLSGECIAQSLGSYQGLERRFDFLVRKPDLVVIDDYAHHPEEIRATIYSAKHLFPNKKLTVVFQPHLFSRTRDLCDGFIEALNLADTCLLLAIYPARELPIEGVDSSIILNGLHNSTGEIYSLANIHEILNDVNPELLLLLGAGDIGEKRDYIVSQLLKFKKIPNL
jgi:UDP-N-acetylmuramate--alanine ligase